MTNIRELNVHEDLIASYSLMHQLRTAVSLEEYLGLVDSMRTEGYRLMGLFDQGTMCALAGFAVRTNLYHKRHLWLYDLVTDEAARSEGYGKILLDYLEKLAVSEHCACLALSSGLQRERAHRFYYQNGYESVSYLFKKQLG
jgi:GNAT superfamily N-acetyltransferase